MILSTEILPPRHHHRWPWHATACHIPFMCTSQQHQHYVVVCKPTVCPRGMVDWVDWVDWEVYGRCDGHHTVTGGGRLQHTSSPCLCGVSMSGLCWGEHSIALIGRPLSDTDYRLFSYWSTTERHRLQTILLLVSP